MAHFLIVKNPNGHRNVINLDQVTRVEVHQILPTQWQIRIYFTEGNPSEYGNFESERSAFEWIRQVFQPDDPDHFLDLTDPSS
ncbi:hypothetical protein [Deinococcus cellulosilyticus]|uniref:Uncharacterized protein n=1 Tax=Deinococcus cellulosilyticus (strain DSM 18568 / NBRC 106333 / KACC 11606 / 5516J-15) TaxID=1223518 RepID=A0A511MZY7_DEIC1|nr:hypothetical protein [Deinococcus cellulosilyticus]GEM46164.1 hypothetical protein DC3_17990 [Deinococcus cellulosilyticus NBRC 106333 = KACC 11606]